MKRSRIILVSAAAFVVVGMSLSAPEAHASPRGKTYKGKFLFIENAACFVFHEDGSFSLNLQSGPPQIQAHGSWFEIGSLWFSFSSFDRDFVFLHVGTTFDQDAALFTVGFFGFIQDGLIPFAAVGQSISAPCEVPLSSPPEGRDPGLIRAVASRREARTAASF
jgi:hypothetical protein